MAEETSAKAKKGSAKAKPDKTLVIVESPAKAKSIGKFLGSRYKVIASVGHVRDLPKSTLGINIEENFEPKYITIKGKGDLVKELKKEAKQSKRVLLATDPDREGEAISWHLAHILGIDEGDQCRIEFHEITKNAIKEAAKNPRTINLNLVDAQQARRVLDRLVGYQISPILWRKVKFGLSAGRVQSAALKIICDREREIKAFVPDEFWPITATFAGGGRIKKFESKLWGRDGKKITITNGSDAEAVLEELKQNSFIVDGIENKSKNRKPFAPFTTATLQQDASAKLGFYARRTMLAAQQLYEGIDIKGEGTVGLVSYIRTDSVRISQEARDMAKDFIVSNYGPEYYGGSVYTNKKKDVQDAHEAIRPTSVTRTPDSIKDCLTKDQYNLYKLIWTRFVASQMTQAKYDVQNISIQNGRYTFRLTGTTMKFDGFLRVYDVKDDSEVKIPALEKNQVLEALSVTTEQHFTQPPPRFTEASLVKYLEENDIGRPSTYAPIVSTLMDRKYAKREKKSLIPTELGFTVTELMENYFDNIVDAGFTAQMEDKLDRVESHGDNWKELIEIFYRDFSEKLEYADKSIEKVKIEDEVTDEICELCGKNMVIKHGRFGEFLACSGYPDCKNTKPILKKVGAKCPECGNEIVIRNTKRGRVFYGCSGFPKCNYATWDNPAKKESEKKED